MASLPTWSSPQLTSARSKQSRSKSSGATPSTCPTTPAQSTPRAGLSDPAAAAAAPALVLLRLLDGLNDVHIVLDVVHVRLIAAVVDRRDDAGRTGAPTREWAVLADVAQRVGLLLRLVGRAPHRARRRVTHRHRGLRRQ